MLFVAASGGESCHKSLVSRTTRRLVGFKRNLSTTRVLEISEEFLQTVEAFVPSILAPEKLVPKTVNGETIKLGDLAHFIQSYCQNFMNDDIPKLESMYMVSDSYQYFLILKFLRSGTGHFHCTLQSGTNRSPTTIPKYHEPFSQ